MEREVWQFSRQQAGKGAEQFYGQVLASGGLCREHQWQFAVETVGAKEGGGVVQHLTLEIMDLLSHDAERGCDSPGGTGGFYARHDDVALCLALAAGLAADEVVEGESVAGVGGGAAERVGMGHGYPLDVVLWTLAQRVDDGYEAVDGGGVVARVGRQHVVAAMEVGGQLDDAASRSLLQADDGSGRQTLHVAEFGVGYQGIVGRDAHGHRLSGQIPGTVGFNVHGVAGRHHGDKVAKYQSNKVPRNQGDGV